MNLNWNYSESTVKPLEIDTTTSKVVVYLRQNIVEVEKTNENDNSTALFYEYDEAKLTKEEYQEYLKELEATDTLQTVEDLKAENQSLTEQISMLTYCLLEMSEAVYA